MVRHTSGQHRKSKRPGASGGIEENVGSAGSTGFIGFGAFATSSVERVVASASNAESTQLASAASPSALSPSYMGDENVDGVGAIAWNPVYTGPDLIYRNLFARIAQKRDALTVHKALGDLQGHITNESIHKRITAEAILHFAWLYHSKLAWSDAAVIRASALRVWMTAVQRVPKAVASIVASNKGSNSCHGELLGLWYAAHSDPAREVRVVATEATALYQTISDKDSNWHWQDGILTLVTRLLSYGRARSLYDAIHPPRTTATTSSSAKSSETVDPAALEQQRDIMEEIYVRIVGNSLDCCRSWLEYQAENANGTNGDTPQTPLTQSISPTQTTSWWSLITNYQKRYPSLRRKSYLLLAAVARTTPHLMPSRLSVLLPQILSSEKESVNLPLLLETILTIVANHQQLRESPNGNNGDVDESIDGKDISAVGSPNFEDTARLLVSPLTKLFQRACYGAKVETWGPMILPFVAQLGKLLPWCEDSVGDNDHSSIILQLLRAATDGASRTLGASDPFHLWAAVAESASYVLIKVTRTNEEAREATTVTYVAQNDGDLTQGKHLDGAKKVAQLWIEAWQFLMTTTTLIHAQRADGPTANAKARLMQDLSVQLIQFESASLRPQAVFYGICDWFWHIAFVWSESTHPVVLSQFLNELTRLVSSSDTVTATERPQRKIADRLASELQKCFTRTLCQYQVSSSHVPCEDDYSLMRAILEFAGPLTVLAVPNDAENDASYTTTTAYNLNSLDSYVMNDLLRWSVIHTSVLTTNQCHEKNNWLVESDFAILFNCINAISNKEKRSKMFSAFIREIVVAKCDLGSLAIGLTTLAQQASLAPGTAWIRCDVLDTFAMDVMGSCVSYSIFGKKELVEASKGKKLELYRTLLGLHSGHEGLAIVGQGVIDKWVDHIGIPLINLSTPKHYIADNALTEALLQKIQVARQYLSIEKSTKVLLAALCIKEPIFEAYAFDILSADFALRSEIEAAASKVLCNTLAGCVVDGCSTCSVETWALRAWRVYRLFQADISTRYVRLGIEDIDLWRGHSSLLFRFSMALFEHLPDKSDCLALVESWDRSNTSKMLVDVLVSLSEADEDFLRSVQSRNRSDRCAQFLAAIGAQMCHKSKIESMIRALIQGLDELLQDSQVLQVEIRRRVAVLSQLLGFLFESIQYTDGSTMTVEEVREGDAVWYIVDRKNYEERVEAKVLKVHYDAHAGYFYSIRVVHDQEIQERQTVIERLRRHPPQQASSGHGVLISAISDDEWTSRASYRDLIWTKLISPFLSSTHVISISELMHIIVDQLGVGKLRGIGSTHYDVCQFVMGLEHRVHTAIDADASDSTQCLWALAITLGLGFNTPTSPSTVDLLRFNPLALTARLISTSETRDSSISRDFDCAMLAFFIAGGIDTHSILDSSCHPLVFFFNIAANVLERDNSGTINGDVIVAAKAIYKGVELSSREAEGAWDDVDLRRAQTRSFICLFRLFALCRDTASDQEAVTGPNTLNWASLIALPQLVQISINDGKLRQSLVEAATLMDTKELCKALFNPEKRYVAFLLLDFLARQGKAIQCDEVIIANSTTNRLRSWLADMNEEEAAIVEEDVFIVAEWVPPMIMEEIESWEDAEFEMHDDSIIVGRLLTWFCFLRCIDASTPVDFRNRPAFVSYLGKCGAVSSILSLGVLHNEIINDHKRKVTSKLLEVEDLLTGEAFADISQLATLSLFRTVEVLPSLSRRWWEDDCPKVYTSAIQLLVEKYVAPAILKRELERIKQVTSFGLMTVTASQASRAVTATYEQDDFKLRVLITLPPSYPFRNAEIDCTKTLGVPQNRRERWSLQITMMLNNQGGTLQDALMLWKDNVDKEFEGLEPCPVCYSVLHVKTHKLPSLECKICHHRFHLDCLSQWFRSSGKSQCVLCQSPWQGTRVQ